MDRLPKDLVLEILEQLGIRDRIHLASVNKHFHSLLGPELRAFKFWRRQLDLFYKYPRYPFDVGPILSR